MAIITLISDFGNADHYVAAIKGRILQQAPTAQIVDITHKVPKFDIVRAAYLLQNVHRDFPKGSIHLVSVNAFSNLTPDFVALYHEGQYFIGPDNGLFSLVFEVLPEQIYALDFDKKSSFPQKALFANVAAYLVQERPFHEIGMPVESIVQGIGLQPVTSSANIRGTVIYIDDYENVVVNVTRDNFEQVRQARKFEIYFKRHDPIGKLVDFYTDVPVGESLCLFNHAGYLEIAVNMGKAATLLDLQLDDTIQIDFF